MTVSGWQPNIIDAEEAEKEGIGVDILLTRHPKYEYAKHHSRVYTHQKVVTT